MPHASKPAAATRERPRAARGRIAPPPTGDHRLLAMGYMVMELADETIAEQDLDASQMLVELAMSVFHTAFDLHPELGEAMRATRRRTEDAVAKIRRALPARTDGAAQWPDQIS